MCDIIVTRVDREVVDYLAFYIQDPAIEVAVIVGLILQFPQDEEVQIAN